MVIRKLDHVDTCTVHSGAKKAHECSVEQLADLFHTTQSRGERCDDIKLDDYLANATGPVPLVLDLRIAHDRWGSSSNPSLNGNLHYPADIDRTLNEAASDKILQYRANF